MARGLLGVERGPGRPAATGHPWFLSGTQRGNDASALRPWTEGNAVQALVDGRTHLRVLAGVLERAATGDAVLFAGWRADADELLDDDGPPVGAALAGAATRGAAVRGLLWRSHLEALGYTLPAHRELARQVAAAGGQVLLDQRVRPLGSHHQEFVVVTSAGRAGEDGAPEDGAPEDGAPEDVAFLGGIDLAHGRRDDAAHRGDRQTRPFTREYGPTPAWHDVQLQVRGPAVRDVETVFRERWVDPTPLTRLPWHTVPDRIRGLDRRPRPLPPPAPEPPRAGSCAVQLLRSYPNRSPGYPFAPAGERSVARGYAKALERARSLVHVEDQYLWSHDVARVFAAALRGNPRLRLTAVVPRYPDHDGRISLPASLVGRSSALRTVVEAGGDRVQVFDLENEAGYPVYVHAKVCIVDDVWAAVGSANLNRRSWTHDSELTAAVLDDELDLREPADPAGLGDGARRFARDLRLSLLREHLGRADGDDADLVHPDGAVAAMHRAAEELSAWYGGGCSGARPPGRLLAHPRRPGRTWPRRLAAPVYDLAYDPDGRPRRMRWRRAF